MEQMPLRSRAWIAAECLRWVQKIYSAENVVEIEIEQLHTPGSGPNWRPGRMTPEPPPMINALVRTRLAELTQRYALEND